jgi:tetratricopeptide (TPR) repeat protein
VLLTLGHVAREDGRWDEAITAYEAAAARANELDDEATEIVAHASAGLAALDQGDIGVAEARLRRADEMVTAGPASAWFTGRERVDALAIRLASLAGHSEIAADRFQRALEAAEPNDAFATATLVAECAPALVAVGVTSANAIVERVRYAAIASGFHGLASRMGC